MNRDEALRLGNERRLELAELRQRIRAGDVVIADLLADPPECIVRMLLADVVRLGFTSTRAHMTVETASAGGRLFDVERVTPAETRGQRA